MKCIQLSTCDNCPLDEYNALYGISPCEILSIFCNTLRNINLSNCSNYFEQAFEVEYLSKFLDWTIPIYEI